MKTHRANNVGGESVCWGAGSCSCRFWLTLSPVAFASSNNISEHRNCLSHSIHFEVNALKSIFFSFYIIQKRGTFKGASACCPWEISSAAKISTFSRKQWSGFEVYGRKRISLGVGLVRTGSACERLGDGFHITAHSVCTRHLADRAGYTAEHPQWQNKCVGVSVRMKIETWENNGWIPIS